MKNTDIYPIKYRRRRLSSGQRFLRYWYFRLLRLQGHPQEIALGLAVGVFAGFFPLFGIQTLVAVLLAFLVKGNKIAAAAGTWVSNPLTSVPLYALNYQVGAILLNFGNSETYNNSLPNWQSWEDLTNLGWDFIYNIFFGSFILGLIAAILTYFFSFRLINNRRRNHKVKKRY